MTAVDHAELKRMADELVQMLAPDQGESAPPALGHAVRIQNAHAALLSEIEGLKAERSFAQSVADVEIEDIDLEYAVVNLLYGRGAIDKKTKTDAVVAVKTLRSIIKAAKALRPQTAESGK